jgi:hypothetical protein
MTVHRKAPSRRGAAARSVVRIGRLDRFASLGRVGRGP